MLSRSICITALFLFPFFVRPQSTARQIQNEQQLASALCALDPESRNAMLKDHPKLINDSLWAYLIDRGAAAYYSEAPERALAVYQIALETALQLNKSSQIATTYYRLGSAYSGLNQIAAAIPHYEKSRSYFELAGSERDQIYILADLGALYLIQEEYEKAREYSERSISIANSVNTNASPGAWPDDFGRARALETLAEIDSRNGEPENALKKLQISLSLFERMRSGRSTYYDFYISDIYSALGRIYPEIGDSARALFYFNKALLIARARSDVRMMAGIQNDIGFLYMEQEDYGQAKAQFEQSLKAYTIEKNLAGEAGLLLNLGVVEQRSANYEDALRYFRLSLQKAEAEGVMDVQTAANEGVGVVLTAMKDPSGAMAALNKALAIATRMGALTRQAEILWRMAQLHYELGDYSKSVELAERAATMARRVHQPKLAYLAMTTLGHSYARQKNFDLAVTILKQAIEQIETLRKQVAGREEELQLFFENKVDAYAELVSLLVQEGKTFDALLYAERSKGRLLLDILEHGRGDLANTMTSAERDQSLRVNRKISELNERIRREASSASLNSLYEQREVARLEYRSLQDGLYASHPDLSIRSGRTSMLARSDLEALTANKDCLYLEYVLSKERVYLFAFNHGNSDKGPDLKVYSLAIKPHVLAEKVEQFHIMLAERHPGFAGLAHELYSLLLKPAAKQLLGAKTLCIIPDGLLWNMPFQALMSASDQYLVEDRAIYYSPSLSVIGQMNKAQERQPKATPSLFALGNPEIDSVGSSSNELCPLPEAATEVAQAAKSFDPSETRVLVGREATESAFKALAPGYTTIHLATHGILDNRHPLFSYLMLTKGQGDMETDGLLEAREIMEMHLHADLAVLSACETADGRVSPGEGMIGMSWAFFVAGCRNTLVSQWKINSASTSHLMEHFYRALESSPGDLNNKKAGALREAMLQLMKDGRYRHPFYWAGFVLVGNAK
jgi:CHAT domain-containing protein/uncharacterized protein HemY